MGCRGRRLLSWGLLLVGSAGGGRADAAPGPRAETPAAGPPTTRVCWPAESRPEMVAEVGRLIGGSFALEHQVRSDDVTCAPDAVWISFTRRPSHVRSTVLAAADRERRLIAVYGDELTAFVGERRGTILHDLAVGRVAAHEIVHVVGAHPGHRGRGLMRPRFSKEMLTGLRRFALEGP